MTYFHNITTKQNYAVDWLVGSRGGVCFFGGGARFYLAAPRSHLLVGCTVHKLYFHGFTVAGRRQF